MSLLEKNKQLTLALQKMLEEHGKELEKAGYKALAVEARMGALAAKNLLTELNKTVEEDDRAFFSGLYRELPDIRPNTISIVETPAYVFTLSSERKLV